MFKAKSLHLCIFGPFDFRLLYLGSKSIFSLIFKALSFEEKKGSHQKKKKGEKKWLVSSILTTTKKKKLKFVSMNLS